MTKEKHVFDLTFADGVQIVDTIYTKLLEEYMENITDLQGPIPELMDRARDLIDNNILANGYLIPRASILMEQFGINKSRSFNR